MNIQKTKMYLSLGLIVGVSILIVLLAVKILFYGSTKVIIDGNHDPLTTQVQFGDKILFPIGNNGAQYDFDGRTGEYQLSVSGPLIVSIDETVSIGPFTNDHVIVSAQKITVDDIVAAVVDPATGSTLADSQLYGPKKNWITTKTESTGVAIRPVFYILQYVDKNWIIIDSGEKINSEKDQYDVAPQDLIDYVVEQAGD